MENQQEILMQLSMFQQQAEQLEEKINIINQQIVEIENLKSALDKIENNRAGKIFANIGKGIFVDAELKSKELLVNIGNGIVVKKSPKETKEVIDRQVGQLSEIKNQLLEQLEEINLQLQHLVMRAREKKD